MKPLLAAAMMCALALAGCADTDGFDGDAAWIFVDGIVYDGDAIRVRSPGTEGHLATADWLQTQLEVDGWDVRLDRFNGTQYSALDKGGAQSWATSCPQSDRDELASLEFANIYATLPGGEGHVVLAAHWDAKEEASSGTAAERSQPIPAANDGASGVGLLLQLQRHLADHRISLPFDLTIAFFDGEDGFEDCHPLAGSIYAARNARLGPIDQFILFDMVGDPDARFIRESRSVAASPDLVDLIWSKAPAHGLASNFITASRSIADDHVPFVEEGIAAVDILDAGRTDTTFPPYWHTAEDTPDKVSPRMLARMGDLTVDLLQDPAFAALNQ